MAKKAAKLLTEAENLPAIIDQLFSVSPNLNSKCAYDFEQVRSMPKFFEVSSPGGKPTWHKPACQT